MRYLLRGLTLLCTLSPLAGAAALLPTRAQVDSWLTQLGGDDRFDPDKGIDWGCYRGHSSILSWGLG